MKYLSLVLFIFGVIYIIQIVTCILEEKGAIVEPKMTDEDN